MPKKNKAKKSNKAKNIAASNSGQNNKKRKLNEAGNVVVNEPHQDPVQAQVANSQPAKKQQAKISRSVFLRQSEQVLDCFFGFSGIVVASFYASLSGSGAEKYCAWYEHLPKKLSLQLTNFQEEFSELLRANEAASTDFTNLISGSPTDKKDYGLVHLATSPDVLVNRAAVFPVVFRKAEVFLQNYDYAEIVTALFRSKEALLQANKNWLVEELAHSDLARASQSQPDLLLLSSSTSSSSSAASSLTDRRSESQELDSQSYSVEESIDEHEQDGSQLSSGAQPWPLQRTASIYGSCRASSVVAAQRSYSVSSTSSDNGGVTRSLSILRSMQMQAQQLVRDEQESLSKEEKVDSLPPVSGQLKRTISARIATRNTPASLVPEQDNVLRYILTILKYQFVTKGQQWFSPLILGPEALEGKIFSRIVRREQPVENSPIIFRNYAVSTKRAKTQAVKLIAEINTFFESKEISLAATQDSSNPNYVEARFNNIDQHKAALHDVYKSGGFKQLLFFEQQAREELGYAASEECGARSSPGVFCSNL